MYRGNSKVLLVEDSLEPAQSIRPLVLQYIPCHIDVRNPSRLLEGDYTADENYLCIVLDLRLPNNTGLDDLVRGRWQRVPLIVATQDTERLKKDLRGIAQ
jgi:DNA-binding response OmpR family regulator